MISVEAICVVGMVSKCFPFIATFTFGTSQKSHEAKSGEYGGWSKAAMPYLVKNTRRIKAFCDGRLLCNKNQLHCSQCSVRTLQTLPHNQFKTFKWYSAFTALLSGMNSWSMIFFELKKTESIVLSRLLPCKFLFSLSGHSATSMPRSVFRFQLRWMM